MQTNLTRKGNEMKTYLSLILAMVFVLVSQGKAQTGAFASNCATLEMQQAAYNQSKANAIVVRDTASQQLQTYYAQLAGYYNNLAKEKQIAEKTAQQDAKTAQQLAKDQQQIEAEKRQVTKDLAQSEVDRNQKAKELELAAREALIKNNEEECQDMWVFCNELKIIIDRSEPDCDKKVSDHVKTHINHSGGADDTNNGGGGNDNGYLNPGYHP